MAGSSKRAVWAALVGNVLVMASKFVAFAWTGSGAMLSEGFHSLADVSNQALLALGLHRSRRPPDATHPYGYLRASYVWALISAVGIFFIGAGVTGSHAVRSWRHPEPIEDPRVALAVLAVALLIEGWTLIVAFRVVHASARARGESLWQAVRHGPDPMAVAVLAEDGAAVVGILVAAVAIVAAWLTGDPRWDAAGSGVISLLLAAVAVLLIDRNREYLIGHAIPDGQLRRILDRLRSDPLVEAVHDVKAEVVGAGAARFKAEITFDGEALARRLLAAEDLAEIAAGIDGPEDLRRFLIGYTDRVVDAIGDEVDRIEQALRDAEPDLRHIDLEAD